MNYKQCKCNSSSSGPRVINHPETEDSVVDGVRVSFLMVKMACDNCDTPWSWQPYSKEDLK